MASPPTLKALNVFGPDASPHTLEVYLDFVCPWSKKLVASVNENVKPLIDGKYQGKIKFFIRLHVQPWHVSSMLTHESMLAFTRVAPQSTWDYILLLFEHQTEYYDIPASKLTPTEIRSKLCDLAAQIIGKDKAAEMLDLLTLKGTPNGGVAVTDDLKYYIKLSRQNGIHVSPSVLWDGLLANEVSSSWGADEWNKFLESKIAA